MKKEWFEAWFDSPYYHVLYKARDEAEAKNSLDKLALALELKSGARVLDLACGKGRHSRYLAEKGYFVTGLDISPESIANAREFENERLEFFQHDMRKPFRINYYDAVLNMFTSFGYFKTAQEHLAALKNMARNLRPGGRLLLDFFNSQWVRQHLVEQEIKTVENIDFHLKKWTENGLVFKTISFKVAGEHFSYTESVRLFELSDFQQMFQACNLTILKTYGSYELDAFDPATSKRLILVAEKPI